MRELVFGGSFNPVHIGHLICARSVAEKAGFDRVILMPTGQSPHKIASPEAASAADRLAMCRLATGRDPLFHVDDRESKRPGKSFTFDTVKDLRNQGQTEVFWLIGADMLNFLPNWHRALELIEICQFVVMNRPGHSIDWNALPQQFHRLRTSVVDAPMIDISSTEIRTRVAAGRTIRYLVPETVDQYITQKRLYAPSPAFLTDPVT